MPYRSLKQQKHLWARRNKDAAFNARFKKESAVINQASSLREQLLKFASAGFVPPPAVASAAARGLELRAKASPSNKGGLTVSQAHQQGIGSGVQRAVDLKNRRALSPKTVRRMSAFFSRHQKNKDIAPGKSPEQDKGYIAWMLWGGDPGRAWADGIVAKMDSKLEKSAAKNKTNYELKTRAEEIYKYQLPGQPWDKGFGLVTSPHTKNMPKKHYSAFNEDYWNVLDEIDQRKIKNTAQLKNRMLQFINAAEGQPYAVPGNSKLHKTAGRPAHMKEHLQNALAKYKAGKELGATEEARLKARGLIPRADGSVHKGKLGMDKAAAKSPSDNVPTDPDLWSRAISEAKKRFKIYPSAYANGWAAKWYKERGGGWKKESA